MDNETSIDPSNLSREFVVEVLRYLVAHPKAKDTIRGIEKWWLSDSVTLEAKQKLEESLEFLVLKGWLIGRSSTRSGKIYWLNEKELPAIKEFLGGYP